MKIPKRYIKKVPLEIEQKEEPHYVYFLVTKRNLFTYPLG